MFAESCNKPDGPLWDRYFHKRVSQSISAPTLHCVCFAAVHLSVSSLNTRHDGEFRYQLRSDLEE